MSGIAKGNQATTIITSNIGGNLDSEDHLVDLQLELNPLERPEMDVVIRTVLRPLQITYDFVSFFYSLVIAVEWWIMSSDTIAMTNAFAIWVWCVFDVCV